MNLKYFVLISISLTFICKEIRCENEEYFKKSIIRHLKDKNGKLKNEAEVKNTYVYSKSMTYEFRSLNKEKFNFKTGIGGLEKTDKNKSFQINFIWFFKNDTREIYIILTKKKRCKPIEISYFIEESTSRDVLNLGLNFSIGGSILPLELLILSYEKDKKSVVCSSIENEAKNNGKKCVIIIKPNTRIEFYLEDKNNYTMYPKKIIGNPITF